jgi:hypothetical protein
MTETSVAPLALVFGLAQLRAAARLPLANLLATQQVHIGDLVRVDCNRDQDRLTFVREGENITVGLHRPDPLIVACATQAKTSKHPKASA